MLRRILASLTGFGRSSVRSAPSVPVNLSPRSRTEKVPTFNAREFKDESGVIVGNELVVVENEASLVASHSSGVNFAYEIPGVWELGNEPGLVRAVDRLAVVGVLLVSEQDLSQFAGTTLFERAAAANVRNFREINTQMFQKPVSTEMQPFSAGRFDAARWMAATDKDGVTARFVKIFVAIAPDWLAQVSLVGDDLDPVVRSLIDTFGSSSDREGYWPLIRERYSEIFSDR